LIKELREKKNMSETIQKNTVANGLSLFSKGPGYVQRPEKKEKKMVGLHNRKMDMGLVIGAFLSSKPKKK